MDKFDILDPNKIAVMGKGHGAVIASHLTRLYPDKYKVAIYSNPIADIGAMSSSPDIPEWPYHVMGINYTSTTVPTQILGASWER